MALTDRETRRKAWLEQIIDAIEFRMTGDISSGASSMSLNGRSLQRYSLDELNSLYLKFNNELKQLDRQAIGQPRYTSVRVRF